MVGDGQGMAMATQDMVNTTMMTIMKVETTMIRDHYEVNKVC